MKEQRENSIFQIDLTQGNIVSGLLWFSIPLMIGNILQQLYNIVDTLVVGKYLGKEALASVGSAYTIMVFLTSVILGLCMGSGAFLSIQYGKQDKKTFGYGKFISFFMIGMIAVLINVLVYIFIDPILVILQIPEDVLPEMYSYIRIIYSGIIATFLYNYFASCLRAIGNSVIPLIFLAVSAVLNVILDLLFTIVFHWGIQGVAMATVFSQYVSGIGICIYTWSKEKILRFQKEDMHFQKGLIKDIFRLAGLTSLQQSIMNFGILMVQGKVNSFGTEVMAAFAAAVKVDTFAYSPVQDFGNAFSTFVAQNHGKNNLDRIKEGIRKSYKAVLSFCIPVSIIIFIFAGNLMKIFSDDKEVISIGISYLRIEGVFYFLIGFLFLYYGYFRAIEKPMISVILTIASLGTRVALAYSLSEIDWIGYHGIWISIPIGWAFADLLGAYFLNNYNKLSGKEIND